VRYSPGHLRRRDVWLFDPRSRLLLPGPDPFSVLDILFPVRLTLALAQTRPPTHDRQVHSDSAKALAGSTHHDRSTAEGDQRTSALGETHTHHSGLGTAMDTDDPPAANSTPAAEERVASDEANLIRSRVANACDGCKARKGEDFAVL
jgi:hypothetical protein